MWRELRWSFAYHLFCLRWKVHLAIPLCNSQNPQKKKIHGMNTAFYLGFSPSNVKKHIRWRGMSNERLLRWPKSQECVSSIKKYIKAELAHMDHIQMERRKLRNKEEKKKNLNFQGGYIYFLRWLIRLNAKFSSITKLLNKFSSCLKFYKDIKPLNVQIFMSSTKIVSGPEGWGLKDETLFSFPRLTISFRDKNPVNSDPKHNLWTLFNPMLSTMGTLLKWTLPNIDDGIEWL